MALETMKGVEKLGEFNVIDMDELRDKYPEKFNDKGGMDYRWFESEIRPKNFVYVRHDVNSIAFTIQNGPVKEKGVNGCQVDTLIAAALRIITGLNSKFPDPKNESAMLHLSYALSDLEDRRLARENRGVEGFDIA